VHPGVTRILLVAVAVLVLAGLSVSVVIGREQGARDWKTELTAFRSSQQVVLPARLPPHVTEATAVTGNGLPLVSFSSSSGPTVTVCTGRARLCRAAVAAAQTLRNERVGGVTALVTVDPGEHAPGRATPLAADLAAFWSTVRLTTARTQWLPPRQRSTTK
jgi:hypothetical protein